MSGRRGRGSGPLRRLARLLRLSEVWDKAVHIAGCALLLGAYDGWTGASEGDLAYYLAGITLLLAGGYAANDAADYRQDRVKEKRPGREAPPRSRSIIAAVAALTLGTALTWTVAVAPAARALAVATILLGLAYSLPPLRFKERGVWGVLVGAAAQRPALFLVWALTLRARGALAVVLALWLFFIGLTGILGHQLLDRKRDRAAGVRTFVFRKGSGPALGIGAASAAAAGLCVISPFGIMAAERAWPVAAAMAAMSGVTLVKSILGSKKLGLLEG